MTQCGRLFSQNKNLLRHVKACHTNGSCYCCGTCKKTFNRQDNFERHQKRCKQTGGKRKASDDDVPIKVKYMKSSDMKIIEIESALSKALVTYRIDLSSEEQNDVLLLIRDGIKNMEHTINRVRDNGIKYFMTLSIKFHQATNVFDITDPPIVFHSEPYEIYDGSDITPSLKSIEMQLLKDIEVFQRNGSGWIINKLLQLDTTVLKHDPLRASTYIPLPNQLRWKNAVLNIKNTDQKCFLWSVIAQFHPAYDQRNANEVYQYRQYEHLYDVTDLNFPISLQQISKFEKLNNISVSVYGYEDKTIYPLRVSIETYENDRHVELLLYIKDDVSHYTLIRNFSRLVSSQVSKHNGVMHFCRFCLHGFSRPDLLSKHLPYCMNHGEQLTVFPKDPILKFTDVAKQLKAPFIVYADFECLLESEGNCGANDVPVYKMEDGARTECQTKYQKHVPCSFAYKIISIDPNYEHELVQYVGEDASEMFLVRLQKDVKDVFDKYIVIPKPMDKLTDKETVAFQHATRCHICNGEARYDDPFVRDHCHIMGKL